MSELSHAQLFGLMFKAFADELDFYTITGTVTEVDESTKTCTVKPDADQPEFNDVRYSVKPSSDVGIVRVPKVGSQVAIGILEAVGGTHAIVVDMQEFDRIVYDDGDDSVVAAEALQDVINNLVGEINTINAKLNSLISTYNTHQHPYVDSGSPSTTASTTSTIGSVAPDANNVDKADFEYSKIKIPKP